jgi:hypothetical protein
VPTVCGAEWAPRMPSGGSQEAAGAIVAARREAEKCTLITLDSEEQRQSQHDHLIGTPQTSHTHTHTHTHTRHTHTAHGRHSGARDSVVAAHLLVPTRDRVGVVMRSCQVANECPARRGAAKSTVPHKHLSARCTGKGVLYQHGESVEQCFNAIQSVCHALSKDLEAQEERDGALRGGPYIYIACSQH